MSFTTEVRTIVDPLLLRLREDLMGSGISFGRIAETSLPVTVVYTTNITEIIDGEGYIKGVKTYQASTLKGSDQTELNFVGSGSVGVSVSSTGVRTTVTISGVASFTDPTTTAGDLIFRNNGGVTTRLPIGQTGYVLMASGEPVWVPVTQTSIPRQIAWYEETPASGTFKGPLRRVDVNCTLINCYYYVKTIASGSNLIFDIKKSTAPNGVFASIFSSQPQLATGSYISSATNFSNIFLASGDILRLDIQQIGSVAGPLGLTVDINMVTR